MLSQQAAPARHDRGESGVEGILLERRAETRKLFDRNVRVIGQQLATSIYHFPPSITSAQRCLIGDFCLVGVAERLPT